MNINKSLDRIDFIKYDVTEVDKIKPKIGTISEMMIILFNDKTWKRGFYDFDNETWRYGERDELIIPKDIIGFIEIIMDQD